MSGIKHKEIVNRKYIDKDLVQFEYVLNGVDGPKGEELSFRFWFEKQQTEDNKTYKVTTIIAAQAYEMIYAMPSRNMDLTLVVATGINQIKYILMDEAYFKNSIATVISATTQNM